MYHVFLADDEPWALLTLKNMIAWSDYGFAVSGEAEDGEQALARINRTNPDLIISDIRMPGMDGLTLLQTIRDGPPIGGTAGQRVYGFRICKKSAAVRLCRLSGEAGGGEGTDGISG